MSTVLLLIHVMVAIALVGVILLQRSEGGALGIGGGGGFMTGRSAGNALTKTTAILAACFFATSLGLSILASQHGGAPSILNPTGAPGGLVPLQGPSAPAPGTPTPQTAPSAPQAPLSK
jgi:preprotein translocase subunit SecG